MPEYQNQNDTETKEEKLKRQFQEARKELLAVLGMNIVIVVLILFGQGAAGWALIVTVPALFLGLLWTPIAYMRYRKETKRSEMDNNQLN